jgi:predicted phosphodiesterase
VFKILQVADLHLGEAEDTAWGPLQDVHSFHVLDSVIRSEEPDLIILSGDQITANNIDRNATSYYEELGQRLGYYGIHWAIIFGNHDDAPLETVLKNGTIVKRPAKTSRRQLLRVDQEFPLSKSQVGPANLFGTSNYILYVNGLNGSPAAQIIFLDSGGGSLAQKLEPDQIEWLRQNASKTLPSVAFQHIPANSQNFEFHEKNCKGFRDDVVTPLSEDPGIVQYLLQAGNVHVLAVGHNHGNDYCCRIENSTEHQKSQTLHVCFGRHTGYGGYGSWDRGARIYELELSQQGTFTWKSWVRMESGDAIDWYEP